MWWRLQPYVVEAATLCDEAATLCGGGCNPMWWRLQPYAVRLQPYVSGGLLLFTWSNRMFPTKAP